MRHTKQQLLRGNATEQQYEATKEIHSQIRTQYHEYNMDQRFDFHATQMETPTKSFFRKTR